MKSTAARSYMRRMCTLPFGELREVSHNPTSMQIYMRFILPFKESHVMSW